ncbi:MAG: CPBP family intramembrane metalloprotease [Verrucomicrobia bacterium]|nr:CPBP family intramembrane metalloprotease [Verrucomicrobiota bacterium]
MNSRPRHSDALIIIGYIVAVLLGAALLAPLLFDFGQLFLAISTTHGWRDSKLIGWIVEAAEKTRLPGYFNRAALIVALAGLWPLFRLLQMTRAEIIGIETPAHEIKNALLGLAVATGAIGVLVALFSLLEVCRISSSARWWSIGLPLVSGLCVACIEEFLFRGAMLGMLRRSLRPRLAILVTTCLFAVLHFLKPPARGLIADEAVNWTSGFHVLTQLFNGFGNWQNVLAEFLLLFAVGWVLAGARVATGGLGLSIGLHAGLVAAMKYFSQVTTPSAAFRRAEFFPWVTENHCKAIVGSYVGLAPIAAVVIAGALALWICRVRVRRQDS